MILKLSKDKKLTFYRKNPIYIGEKDFNTIEVLISPTIDGNETNELDFILHLVNKDGEYLHINLDKEIKEDIIVGSTQITTDITSIAQKFSVYIEMIRGNNEIIGKTNVLEIEVNPLPDEQGEITPEEIERRSTIISQDNPLESSHKKYKLNALWINYTDKTQFVLTSIDESQAPEKYVYTWERNNNHVVVSTETAPEYTPDNVDYQYSDGDIWIQANSETDKIVSISVCTSYTKELIDDETWKYNYTWAILNSGVTNYNELNNKPRINNIILQGNKTSNELGLQDKLTAGQNITITEENVISASSGSDDYTDLTNKPSINNVTLSGNKTSNDLNLQGKLTAGENITISGDNVISAGGGGGVTSYNDLADKPVLRIQTGSTTENITIEDVIKLTPFYKIFGTDIIALDTSRLYNKIIDGIHSYTDFDSISNTTRGGVVLCSINAEGIPSFINARNRKFVLYNFEGLHDDGCAQLIFWIDNTSGESKSAFRVGTGGLWQASDWVELTDGGSQIVSGVVNANGTITFTDSDGNTFTTTGSSVIGPQGDDYILTAQDKSDIADIVLSELPTTQGVLYGN